MAWGHSRNVVSRLSNTPKEALDLLVKQNGFIKFDALLDAAQVTVKDSGLLAVYDLILATMSFQFATCLNKASLPKCSPSALQICEKCKVTFRVLAFYTYVSVTHTISISSLIISR